MSFKGYTVPGCQGKRKKEKGKSYDAVMRFFEGAKERMSERVKERRSERVIGE